MRASISFEDTEDGVIMTLNFDDPLTTDPEEATDAQLQAMVAFKAFIDWDKLAFDNGGWDGSWDEDDLPEDAPSV